MNLIPSNKQTMSSREIAELTGSRHDSVRKSARRLEANGLLTSPLAESAFRTSSGSHQEFHFNKRDSLVLVARLSPEFTAAVIDRWQELESAELVPAASLPDFSNPAEAARAWAEQYELKTAAQEQLQLAAPKVAFVENLVDRTNLMNATQVGSKHGLSAVKLNTFLKELGGVYDSRTKRAKVFTNDFVKKGYGENKKTESGYDQPLFTNAGEIWINEQLINEGVV